MDILDRRKIQVFSPDERLQLTQKAPAGAPIAGNRAGLYQRCTLPILSDALIIGEGCGDQEGGRSRRRIRAEPEIGAKDVAVGGPLVENAAEISRHPNKKSLNAVPSTDRRSGRVVEKDQVDIARVIELAAPELPHAENDQSAVALRVVGADQAGDA